MSETQRLRDGLQHIADDARRNRWHPDSGFPTEYARAWHDGFVTLAAHHSIEAKRYLDPEGSAEDEELWRLGHQGTDTDWWRRTGHCGHCGIVASSCVCNGECDCWADHGPPLKPWQSLPARLEEAEAKLAKIRALDRPEMRYWHRREGASSQPEWFIPLLEVRDILDEGGSDADG